MNKLAIILAVMALAVGLAVAQTTPKPPPAQSSPSLRIVAPLDGQKINTTFINVRYELLNGGGVGNLPRFRVQLDARDPVSITATEYTFTGIRPGNHVVRVDLVDANDTPISGAGSEVQFTAVPGPDSPAGRLSPGYRDGDPEALPGGGSELPLLSIIGFGVLLGGILSAMRTR